MSFVDLALKLIVLLVGIGAAIGLLAFYRWYKHAKNTDPSQNKIYAGSDGDFLAQCKEMAQKVRSLLTHENCD